MPMVADGVQGHPQRDIAVATRAHRASSTDKALALTTHHLAMLHGKIGKNGIGDKVLMSRGRHIQEHTSVQTHLQLS